MVLINPAKIFLSQIHCKSTRKFLTPKKSQMAKFKPKKGSSPPDIPEYLKEKQPWTKLHDTDQNYGQIPVFLATLLIKKEC